MCFYFVLNLFDFLNIFGVDEGFLCNRRMWFGVSVFRFCGLLDIGVIGLLFKIFFIFIRNVCNVLLFRRCFLINEYKIFLMECISFF